MRFPWRKKIGDSDGLKVAEAERALSERKFRESQSLRDALRDIRQRNHVGELITTVIQQKTKEAK